MTLAWGPDISNWDSIDQSDMDVWKSAGVGVAMPRASLERAAMMDITRQQVSLIAANDILTPVYGWCYGDDIPEIMVDSTVKLVDDITNAKILVFDVEDIQSFVIHFAQNPPVNSHRLWLPRRFLPVDPHKVPFSALPPSQAVSWLQRAFIETRKLGWEPWIYSAAYCWNPMTGTSLAFRNEKWVVADWDTNGDPSIIQSVGGKSSAEAKQYLGSGQGASLNGQAFDFDVWTLEAMTPPPPVVVPPTPPVDNPPVDNPPVIAGSEPEADAINAALQIRFSHERVGIGLMQEGLRKLLIAAGIDTPPAAGG